MDLKASGQPAKGIWDRSVVKIGLISLVCCLFGCVALMAVAGFRGPLFNFLVGLLASPILLVFGWFTYPAVYVIVALAWSCYTESVATVGLRKRVFLAISAVGGAVVVSFFALTQTGADPVIGGMAGALAGYLITRWKYSAKPVRLVHDLVSL